MTEFPETLKGWRKARRFSQLDLAVEADVSARHISFLETGRARPSREMIGRLGDALQLPLATRNLLLTHAGFAARYPGRKWDAQEMAPIRKALDYMLLKHDPYPAFAIDRMWTIVQMNKAADTLFGLTGASAGTNVLDLLMTEALQALIVNWPEVAHHFAQRLRTESAAQGGNSKLDDAATRLTKVPYPENRTFAPVVPAIYRFGERELSLFSTIAQFGSPEDLTLDELKVELFFPSDEQTEAALRAMIQ